MLKTTRSDSILETNSLDKPTVLSSIIVVLFLNKLILFISYSVSTPTILYLFLSIDTNSAIYNHYPSYKL